MSGEMKAGILRGCGYRLKGLEPLLQGHNQFAEALVLFVHRLEGLTFRNEERNACFGSEADIGRNGRHGGKWDFF